MPLRRRRSVVPTGFGPAVEEASKRLERLNAEADRQLGDSTSRRSASGSRSGLLIGASSIASGLAASGSGDWATTAAFAFLLAAAVGLLSLLPRMGRTPKLRKFYATPAMRGDELEDMLLQAKMVTLDEDESRLRLQAALVKIGFGVMGLAILFLALHAGHVMIDHFPAKP